jgi:hypothetical protein
MPAACSASMPGWLARLAGVERPYPGMPRRAGRSQNSEPLLRHRRGHWIQGSLPPPSIAPEPHPADLRGDVLHSGATSAISQRYSCSPWCEAKQNPTKNLPQPSHDRGGFLLFESAVARARGRRAIARFSMRAAPRSARRHSPPERAALRPRRPAEVCPIEETGPRGRGRIAWSPGGATSRSKVAFDFDRPIGSQPHDRRSEHRSDCQWTENGGFLRALGDAP